MGLPVFTSSCTRPGLLYYLPVSNLQNTQKNPWSPPSRKFRAPGANHRKIPQTIPGVPAARECVPKSRDSRSESQKCPNPQNLACRVIWRGHRRKEFFQSIPGVLNPTLENPRAPKNRSSAPITLSSILCVCDPKPRGWNTLSFPKRFLGVG